MIHVNSKIISPDELTRRVHDSIGARGVPAGSPAEILHAPLSTYGEAGQASSSDLDIRIKEFVRGLYLFILGREPDEGGFKGHYEALIKKEKTPFDVVYFFLFSEELNNMQCDNNDLVNRLYRGVLRRDADERALYLYTVLLDSGSPRDKLLRRILQSGEFMSVFQNLMNG